MPDYTARTDAAAGDNVYTKANHETMTLRSILGLLLLANLSYAQSQLFVVNSLDESAGVIDLASGVVNAQAVALGNIPNDIITHDGMLYVTNSGYNNVQEIDPLALQTTREIEITSATNVWSMVMLNNDSMAVSATLSKAPTSKRRRILLVAASISTN